MSSSDCSKNGLFYCIVHSSGKPLHLTEEEVRDLAMSNWDISIYGSERGRNIGIKALQRWNTPFIYTCEIGIRELLARSRHIISPKYDKSANRNMLEHLA